MATNYGKLDFAVAFNRQTAYPLDGNAYFESKATADAAIENAKAAGSSSSQYYYGQLITVYENGAAKIYQIQKQDDKKAVLAEIGGKVDLDGYVTGPSSSTNTAIAVFNGTDGKTIKNTGVTINSSNVISTAGGIKLTNGNCTLRLYNTSASPTDYSAIEVRSNSASTNRNLFIDLANNSLVVGAASGTADTTYKVNVKDTFNATTIYENGKSLANKYADKNHNHNGTYLTAESDTLQTVTTRGATTDKAITTAGLTTTSTLYITGTTGHREGIRIAPFGNLSSIWWNATGTQDYTTGQMWGITAYDKSYTLDATKTNTFRFRGPTSSTATSATDQMWINTSGLVTSRGGFAKSGSSDTHVLLAGGGTKALSEFGIGTGGSLDLSNYVDLTSPQKISGNKTFTGNVITSNNKFEIKATGNTDDSWIKLTNATDDGYYAFGIRRPYNTYGLQLKIKAAGKPESEAEYYDIWNAHNDGSGSGLDADKLDGQEGTYYLDYNNFTNKPTIPAAQIQSDWNQTNTSKADYIKNKPTIPTIPTNVVTGSSLTSNQVIVGNGNSTIKDSGISLSTKGNASAKAAVVRPNPGQIHSVYYVMTEGETARASWGYNATTDCVELAWR